MAQRKDPLKTNTISETHLSQGLAFVTFDPSKPDEAQNALDKSQALQGYQAVANRTRWEDVHTNTSIRNSFNRSDYEAYRPGETVPTKRREIQNTCNRAYKRVGIIRKVIDLMSDFGSQGVKVHHPNKRIQRFARRWFKHKVRGHTVTERFLNYFYRLGTAVAQRRMAKISISEERRLAIAGDDVLKPTEKTPSSLKTQKRNIPNGYNFLNPMSLEVAGGELSQFIGKREYALKITGSLRMKIQSPQSEMDRQLIAILPPDLKAAALRGDDLLPLDNSRLSVHGYKQDDWEPWASPMLEAILDDLILLEKMKLADLAALDGAISQIRIWKLGDLDKGLLPTDAAISKLADILLSNPGGGSFDLIWGPELNFEDASTNVHQFLGGSKYEPVYDAIHSGMGVPSTLTGSTHDGGATNNFIALQTLVQRLEYGREAVTCFWEQELELLRQAMGWKKSPTVSFDNMILKDEASLKALLIQAWDRNIISDELLIEKLGESPELEDLRKSREQKERERGARMPQAGPYFSTEKIHELAKTALSRGYITPKQAGLDVDDDGDVAPFDKQLKAPSGGGNSPENHGPVGKSGQGRPKNSKDEPGTNRDRTAKVRTSAVIADDVGDFLNAMVWAKYAQQEISNVVTPAILEHYGKKNLRSLSAKEAKEAELVKFRILSNMRKYKPINPKQIIEAVHNDEGLPKNFSVCYQKLIASQTAQSGKEPTVDELRNLQAAVYSLFS
jgi:hypothetical protein